MTISVKPQTFTKVEFAAADIVQYAGRAGALVLDPVPAVHIEVDEDLSTSRVAVTSLSPARFRVESGALEEFRHPRHLSEHDCLVVFSRLFLELQDRLAPGFGAPDLDAEPARAERMAWDVNLYGRVARLGLRVHVPRHRYNFRTRHGFTDVADRAFDTLWNAGDLVWSEIAELSRQAQDPVNASHH